MEAHVLSLLFFTACGDDAVTPSRALVHGAWETADGYLAAAIEQAIER